MRSIAFIAAFFLAACGGATTSSDADPVGNDPNGASPPDPQAATSVCDGQPIVVTTSGGFGGQGAGFLLIDGACTFYAGDGFRAARTGALTHERAADIASALGVGAWTQPGPGGDACGDCISYSLRHGSLVTDPTGVPSTISFESVFAQTLQDLIGVGAPIANGPMTLRTAKRPSNDSAVQDIAWPLSSAPDGFSNGGSVSAAEAAKLRPFATPDRAETRIVAHTKDGSRWDVVFGDEIPFPR